MKIFLSVGEPSGDLHGANLIRELNERSDEPIEFVGYGGPRMQEAGCDLHTDLTQLAVMGLMPVLKILPRFLKLASQAKQYFREHKPDAVVLIDFPGFNWHIAKHAKRQGIPVFYYGTPQLWAWAPWRVRKMRRTVDHALCKLPFEETWLRERGCNATHVGHPYFDELRTRQLDEAFVEQQRGDTQAEIGPLVTILPGSRTQEVTGNFESQLLVAKKVRAEVPNVRFVVAAFKESHAERCRKAIREANFAQDEEPVVHLKRTPELIEAATCCLAVSGSVSLELLYHTKPTTILYTVSPIALWLSRFFRHVRYITLVNLLSAKNLFETEVGFYERDNPIDSHVLMPEYLSSKDRSRDIAPHLIEWLTNESSREELVERMRTLREQVGGGGASVRAADYLLNEMRKVSTTNLAA